jgi:hypothetical protein
MYEKMIIKNFDITNHCYYILQVLNKCMKK